MVGCKVSAIGLAPKRLTLKIESRLNQHALARRVHIATLRFFGVSQVIEKI